VTQDSNTVAVGIVYTHMHARTHARTHVHRKVIMQNKIQFKNNTTNHYNAIKR